MNTITVPFRRATFKNPLPKIVKGFYSYFEMVGYARACAELTRQGYHAEAKALMLEKAKLMRKES